MIPFIVVRLLLLLNNSVRAEECDYPKDDPSMGTGMDIVYGPGISQNSQSGGFSGSFGSGFSGAASGGMVQLPLAAEIPGPLINRARHELQQMTSPSDVGSPLGRGSNKMPTTPLTSPLVPFGGVGGAAYKRFFPKDLLLNPPSMPMSSKLGRGGISGHGAWRSRMSPSRIQAMLAQMKGVRMYGGMPIPTSKQSATNFFHRYLHQTQHTVKHRRRWQYHYMRWMHHYWRWLRIRRKQLHLADEDDVEHLHHIRRQKMSFFQYWLHRHYEHSLGNHFSHRSHFLNRSGNNRRWNSNHWSHNSLKSRNHWNHNGHWSSNNHHSHIGHWTFWNGNWHWVNNSHKHQHSNNSNNGVHWSFWNGRWHQVNHHYNYHPWQYPDPHYMRYSPYVYHPLRHPWMYFPYNRYSPYPLHHHYYPLHHPYYPSPLNSFNPWMLSNLFS